METDRHELWAEFLGAWPPERVRQMTLQEYTNPGKDDAFIYWIESRLEELGSIWGGSAFKFGIYCRDKTASKEAASGRVWGEKYAWLAKFGATEQEAFAAVRTRLVEVIDASRQGNFARVEEVDLAPMLKWKVAFLYQDRKEPTVFPVFKKEWLFLEYKSIDPRARLGSTPYHLMYETLMARSRELGDVFRIAQSIWERHGTEKPRETRAFAVPLSWTIQEEAAIDALCGKTRVEAEDVDSYLNNLLAAADLAQGDGLALLVDAEVRALATLTHAEPGQFAWDQAPVNFPSGLLVNPTSEVRELTASERQFIWGHLSVQQPTRDLRSAGSPPSPGDATPKSTEPPPPPCEPRNIILYGPPGTGKTYSTVRRALELILGADRLAGLGDKDLLPVFRDHQARGQIEFVTFHQAYGYEEFVEGIRPVLDQGADAQVRYEIHDGVFKRIALRAAAEGLRIEGTTPEFEELWELLVRDLKKDGTRIAISSSDKTYQLSVSTQGSIVSNACEVDAEGEVTTVTGRYQVASKDNARLYWQHRAELGPEPEKFTYEKTTQLFAREKGGSGGNHYTALWIVYTQLLALSRTAGLRKAELIDRTTRVHQALDKPGPTTTFSFSTLSPQYVLILDEAGSRAPAGLRAAVDRLDGLTPGDFAVAGKESWILGGPLDGPSLVAALERELAHKDRCKKTIPGFSAPRP